MVLTGISSSMPCTDNWVNDRHWELVGTLTFQNLTTRGMSTLRADVFEWFKPRASLSECLQMESTRVTICTEGSAHVAVTIRE